jgi:hypothetical protein
LIGLVELGQDDRDFLWDRHDQFRGADKGEKQGQPQLRGMNDNNDAKQPPPRLVSRAKDGGGSSSNLNFPPATCVWSLLEQQFGKQQCVPFLFDSLIICHW